MPQRTEILHTWLQQRYPDTPWTLSPLAGDASFRRYFRLQINDQTLVVMDAPPEKENVMPWVLLSAALNQQGVHAPAVIACNPSQGFLLLEDFGNQCLLDALDEHTAKIWYPLAMQDITRLQHGTYTDIHLPSFDEAWMLGELHLMRDWFLTKHLGLTLTADQNHLIEQSFHWITQQLQQQPQVFIHRDYHSRNLMIIPEPTPHLGVIDFQDAMIGPYTYDLVSLLKDCYIQWPTEQVLTWVRTFYEQAHITESFETFYHGFTLCGLQRHLKVLGVFCRLHWRDHKSQYLNDLPQTFNYVMNVLKHEKALQPLYDLMCNTVEPLF